MFNMKIGQNLFGGLRNWLGWLLLVQAVVFCFFALWWFARKFDLSASDIASWVQAIGSILAVAAAAGVVIYQNQYSADFEKEKNKDQRIGVAFQIKHLIAFASWPSYGGAVSPWTPEQKLDIAKSMRIEEQQRLLERLISFPIFEIKDPMPVTQMTAVEGRWREAISKMRKVQLLIDKQDKEWEREFDELSKIIPASQNSQKLDDYVWAVRHERYTGYPEPDRLQP